MTVTSFLPTPKKGRQHRLDFCVCLALLGRGTDGDFQRASVKAPDFGDRRARRGENLDDHATFDDGDGQRTGVWRHKEPQKPLPRGADKEERPQTPPHFSTEQAPCPHP